MNEFRKSLINTNQINLEFLKPQCNRVSVNKKEILGKNLRKS